jgi:hypothetical protein
MRETDDSYEEVVTELLNICEASELTLSYGGDHVPGQ